MKKLLVLFGVLAFSCSVSLAITSEQVSDLNNLQREGFSDSALQIVDLVKYRNGYKREYQHKKGRIGAYSRLKIYVDPYQDDGQFGEHQVNFSNTWNGDLTRYSTQFERKETVENL